LIDLPRLFSISLPRFQRKYYASFPVVDIFSRFHSFFHLLSTNRSPPLSLLAMRKQDRQTHFDDCLCSCNDYLSTTILKRERERERERERKIERTHHLLWSFHKMKSFCMNHALSSKYNHVIWVFINFPWKK